MPNDKRLTDHQFNSLIARKSIKPKTYGKTKPRQEKIIDIRSMTDKSSILIEIWVPKRSKIRFLGSPGSQNSSWKHLGSAKGQPETHKGGLGEPNRCHRGCLETPLDSLGTPWGLPGDSLGTAWEAL